MLRVVRKHVVYLACGSQNSGYLETSGNGAMHFMSVSTALKHLGYKSRSQLCKLMNDGWLDAHVYVKMPSGLGFLDVDGYRRRFRAYASGESIVSSFAELGSVYANKFDA